MTDNSGEGGDSDAFDKKELIRQGKRLLLGVLVWASIYLFWQFVIWLFSPPAGIVRVITFVGAVMAAGVAIPIALSKPKVSSPAITSDHVKYPPPSGQAAIEAIHEWFEFATDHSFIFSALAVIAFAVMATVFIFGYLCVFDWRLIWAIDYTQIC
jgi:hypothetical protein